MKFLTKDDYIIFMAHNEYRVSDNNDTYLVHSVGDRIRMREAGILTAHEQPAWSHIEPEKGQYNWDYLDMLIKRNRDAGIKSLIQLTGWRNPAWMPNDWFAKTQNGKIERECFSFWNEEAIYFSDLMIIEAIKHYENQKDVMFFHGDWQGGEGAFPASWCIYDSSAVQDYKKIYGNDAMPVPENPDTMKWMGQKIIDVFIHKARIFYAAYGEIWNAMQYLMNTWTHAFGNFVHPEILEKVRKTWPDANIALMQYTYFDSAHDDNNVKYVDNLVKISQCEVIVEAMFASGLPITAPKAIAKGFRGQILHPTWTSFDGGGLDDRILTNIRNANDLWKRVGYR